MVGAGNPEAVHSNNADSCVFLTRSWWRGVSSLSATLLSPANTQKQTTCYNIGYIEIYPSNMQCAVPQIYSSWPSKSSIERPVDFSFILGQIHLKRYIGNEKGKFPQTEPDILVVELTQQWQGSGKSFQIPMGN